MEDFRNNWEYLNYLHSKKRLVGGKYGCFKTWDDFWIWYYRMKPPYK